MRRLPNFSWAGLLALLVVEVLALTIRFDEETLGDRQGWIAGFIAHSHVLIALAISMGVVIGGILYGSARDDRGFRRHALPISRSRRVWPYLVGHLAAYGGLAWLTGSIFESSVLSSNPLPRFGLWMGAGLATLGLWMLAAAPLDHWGWLVRTQWRPCLFASLAGVATLLMGRWTSSLWGLFHGSTFYSVRSVLSLFYGDVVCLPNQFVLGTPRFEIEISSECSGFEGIGLIWAFLGVCFWWFRRELRFPQVFLLIPVGTALSWMFNVFRIAALIALGDAGWDAMADGGFHSQAGWLAFNGIALGLIVLSRTASRCSPGSPRRGTSRPRPPTPRPRTSDPWW